MKTQRIEETPMTEETPEQDLHGEAEPDLPEVADYKPAETPPDTGDRHPICGLVEDLIDRYFDDGLSKADALKRFGRILDLYPSDSDSGKTVESTRRALQGREPAPRPFDSARARKQLYGQPVRPSSFDAVAARESLHGK